MGHAPENTRESFEKAIALGCDELETDVWLVDGRFAIAHDRENADAAPLSLDDVLALTSLVNPGDEVVIVMPNYMQVHGVATACTCM